MGPSKKSVVIGDYQSLKEAFKDDKGNGRPLDFMWLNEEFRHGDGTDSRGLLFSVVSNVFDSIPPVYLTDQKAWVKIAVFFLYRISLNNVLP